MILSLDTCQSYEFESTWQNQTDTGRIVLPRNIFITDSSGRTILLGSKQANVGGFTSDPIFMRGDAIELQAGYSYATDQGTEVKEMATIFKGYISKVHSGTPIEFEVEDSMWMLKQTPMPNKTYTDADGVEKILQDIVNTCNTINGTSLTYKAITETTFGQLITGNETAAQLLNRLQQIYGLRSYFRDESLRCGVLIDNPDEGEDHYFIMNGDKGNVHAQGQRLEYRRTDDIRLSAIAYNTVTKASGETTKDGQQKMKKERLQVLVSVFGESIETKVIPKGERVPENQEGERRTFFFPEAQSTERLSELAIEQLRRYAYKGLSGNFVAFGIPFVRHCDYAVISNPQETEQDGTYRIKKVVYSGSDGLQQQIELDYKVL